MKNGRKALIKLLLALNLEIEEARELWNALVLQLREEVDTVIIACTDLNVVASEDFVASSQCLAKAVVRMYVENIRGPNEYILLAIVFRKIMFFAVSSLIHL